jgi:two-component system heavy metal sensor histidine kinase CusS
VRSIGVRLAVSYALAATLTMIVFFVAGRYFLEKYVVHSLDLLIQDDFEQVKLRLGPDITQLTGDQIQERLRESTAYESILYYVQISGPDGKVVFTSHNLSGTAIPDISPDRFYNAHIPGFDFEFRVAQFTLGPMRVAIATSKAQVKTLIGGYLRVFLGLLAAMILISASTGYFLSRLALAPVRLIQQTANRISSANLSERIPVSEVRDEISNLALLLNQMFDRIESSFNQVRRFTAEASHELKTPLSLIRLQAEKLLVEGGLSAAQEESVQMQLEEAARLNQIIEELLFLSRAEARAITLSLRRENPKQFLYEFEQDARVLAEHRGVRFAENLSGEGLVEFDQNRIRQVLLNLLTNALEVSPKGSEVRLFSEMSGGMWRVAVEDEGPGVPPEQREAIFERFVMLARPGAQNSPGGSGLGLAISRSIIGLHKGTIRAVPAVAGTGLRVVFEIPVDRTAS